MLFLYVQKIFLFIVSQLIVINVHALCVTTSKANLRTKPGSKSPISWTVAKYTPLIELRKSGGWYEVEDMDGETHWVYSQNVSRKMVCVAIKVSTAKLRKTPGASGEIAEIRQVDRYTPFKRVDIEGEWYQVEASWGEAYSVHESTVWRPVKVSRIKF